MSYFSGGICYVNCAFCGISFSLCESRFFDHNSSFYFFVAIILQVLKVSTTPANHIPMLMPCTLPVSSGLHLLEIGISRFGYSSLAYRCLILIWFDYILFDQSSYLWVLLDFFFRVMPTSCYAKYLLYLFVCATSCCLLYTYLWIFWRRGWKTGLIL